MRNAVSFKKTKKITDKNILVEELLKSGLYETIWSKYNQYLEDTGANGNDNEKIFEYLNEKEFGDF